MTASGVAIRYGVRIDEKRFPATHSLQRRIINISRYFKHPPEDIFQECMIAERTAQCLARKRKITKKKITAYVITSAYNYLRQHSKKAAREPSYNEIYDGTFVKFNRREIGIKLALKETYDILKGIDRTAAGIFKNMLTEQSNWHQLYREYYQDKIERHKYWKKVWEIQTIAQAVMKGFKRHMRFNF